MGCDIHAAIEFKNGSGQWQAVLFKNKYAGRWEGEEEFTARLDFGRNYDAFAILANVRNGRGFAGVETGSGFDPISDGRGLPEDITPEGRNACSGDHSDTHVSAAELLSCDWTRTITKYGVVDVEQFEKWDRMKQWEPRPDSYCGDVSGGMVKKISENEMRTLVNSYMKDNRGSNWDVAMQNMKADHPSTYCRISWVETYASAAGQLWSKWVPEILKLSNQYGADNVRLVMNFDS